MSVPQVRSTSNFIPIDTETRSNSLFNPQASSSSSLSSAAVAVESPGFFATIKSTIYKCLSYLPLIGRYFTTTASTTTSTSSANTPVAFSNISTLSNEIDAHQRALNDIGCRLERITAETIEVLKEMFPMCRPLLQLQLIDKYIKSESFTPTLVKELVRLMPQENQNRLNWHVWFQQDPTNESNRPKDGRDIIAENPKGSIVQQAVTAYIAELVASGVRP